MPAILEELDAFGQALLDHRQLTLEAEDGTSMPAMEPAWFFQTNYKWYPWKGTAIIFLTVQV